nr:BspA family leucine-rich repeat surface protein [Mycoplasmopsis bovis]
MQKIFNQPLNSWNVSKVTNMYEMLFGAHKFNQDLNEWNVSNVTNMERMFKEQKVLMEE